MVPIRDFVLFLVAATTTSELVDRLQSDIDVNGMIDDRGISDVDIMMLLGEQQMERGDFDAAIQTFWGLTARGEVSAFKKIDEAYFRKGSPAGAYIALALNYIDHGAINEADGVLALALERIHEYMNSDPEQVSLVNELARTIASMRDKQRQQTWSDVEENKLSTMCAGFLAADFPDQCSVRQQPEKKDTAHAPSEPHFSVESTAVDANAEGISSASVADGRRQKQQRIVFYLHFHKAAGTTMCEIARTNRMNVNFKQNCNDYNSHRCCGDTLEHQATFARSTQLDFVANEGSMPDGPMDLDSFEYFTCLRNPVSRAISHYHHARLTRPTQLANISLEDWVQNLPDNYYVRYLNGPSVLNLPQGTVNASHLLRAMARLKLFRGVLIMEWLDQSQEQLVRWFGWKVTDPSGKNRRGTKRNSHQDELPTADASGPLFPLFQLDSMLYKYATFLNLGHTDAAAALTTKVESSLDSSGSVPSPPFPTVPRRCGADYCCGVCLWTDF